MTQTLSVGATSEISALVREHHAAREPLRITGASTWLHAGAPVRATTTLSVGDDRGIVEYVPGDLTITVRGGTRLHDVADATRAAGQFLPLDPWGGDDGTVGATIATATAGPRAAAFGVPRDAVLGVEFVTGTGAVVRAGGRVVKNVAGFDLARLVTGSWGTLGVVTEATLRLRAMPERYETLAIELDDGDASLGDVAHRLRHLPFSPLAAQIVNARLARRLRLRDGTLLLAQIGGNARAVSAQRDALRALSRRDADDVSDDVWKALRECDRAASATWRWSQPPASFADTWSQAVAAANPLDALVHGDPWRGVVRVVVGNPGGATTSLARAAGGGTGSGGRFPGVRMLEVLPASAWRAVDASADDALSRAVRDKFDPAGILNPGIMGGGST